MFNTEMARYLLGRDKLGSVFECFALILLKSAANDNISRLAFISRDGAFLREVTELVSRKTDESSAFQFNYIYLSRISTALSKESKFSESSLSEAFYISAGKKSLKNLLAYFGIECGIFAKELHAGGIDPEAPLNDLDIIKPLLDDCRFIEKVKAERDRQRGLLSRYLLQEQIPTERFAFVDVGWRGSIVSALAKAFSGDPGFSRLRAYYLGHWNETGDVLETGFPVSGLLSDMNRRRNIFEGSAHYLAHPIEAICRANHGTVVGYREIGNSTIAPVLLAEDASQRQIEVAGEAWREPILQGIRDYLAESPKAPYVLDEIDIPELRKKAQRLLFTLAFFPNENEIRSLSPLVHTEGHAENWSTALITEHNSRPWSSPRKWIAGLASPWRSGYVMATGGRPFALLFVLVEALLVTLPPSFRTTLRKSTLRVAART